MELVERVLIMDDEQLVREPLRSKLQKAKFNVVLASSVKRALRVAQKSRFDAAILDARMDKDCEGLEVVREFRNKWKDIYLEVLTGHPQYEKMAIESGADLVTFKPRDTRGNAPVIRLRDGISRKRLASLAEIARVRLSEREIPDWGVVGESRRQWASVQATVFRECLGDLERFIEGNRVKYRLDASTSKEILADLSKFFVCHVLDTNRREEATKDSERADSVLSDLNVETFLKLEEELKRTFIGHFVAICNGEVVAVERSKAELFSRLQSTLLSKPCLVRELSAEGERVIEFRRPRHIIRK